MYRLKWILLIAGLNSSMGCSEERPLPDQEPEWRNEVVVPEDDPGLPGYNVISEAPDLAVPAVNYDFGEDLISPSEAQQIVWSAYPDYDFGEDIMSGPEQVGDIWIDAYMMSADVNFDVLEVLVDAHTGEIVKEVLLEGFAAPHALPCTLSGVASGAWYNQNGAPWNTDLLGNSAVYTIGSDGCVITSLAMAYNDLWATPTTPRDLNNSARTSGCFGPADGLVTVSCAINSRGGPHGVSDISISSVATSICAGNSVMVDVTWGGGHKMLTYSYNGGSTSSKSSYTVIDPWNGASKSMSAFTPTRWRALY
jgi:hypothetical protein